MAYWTPARHRLEATPATPPPATLSLAVYVQEAARQLQVGGWRVTQQRASPGAPWHLAAAKGAKWRVVQILLPGTGATARHEERQRLGAAALVPAKLGTMEQWLAHLRPGGRVVFGMDPLSGHAWHTAFTSAHDLAARFGAVPVAPGSR
jgi:hypothetical protein